MQPLQCVSQPWLPKHHVTAKRRNTQNTSNQHLHCELRRAQPALPHTGCTFHRRLQPLYAEKRKVSCSAFSPTQAPCNIHAAITMRFATKFRKHHVIAKRRNRFPRKSTRFRGPASSPTHRPMQHSCSHYNAFRNQVSKAPCNCEVQKQVPTEKHKVSWSGFLPNTRPMQHSCSHYIAFCNATHTFMQPLRCHFPKSTSHNHHFQQSPHSLRHHFPSSPLPFVTTSQVTHSLGQHFPNILAYALFTIIYPHVCCLQCIQMMSHFRPFPCEFWLGHARSRIGCPISLQGYCRRHITKIHQRKQRKAYDHLSKIVV